MKLSNSTTNAPSGAARLPVLLSAYLLALPLSLAADTTGVMNVYVDTLLTQDHVGSINILADIKLDCDGHSITSTDPRHGIGVSVNSANATTGVTVRNCRAIGFQRGFYAIETEYVSFIDNIAINNDLGFDVSQLTPWASLEGNVATDNDTGFSCNGLHCQLKNNVSEFNLNFGLNLGVGSAEVRDNLVTESSWGIRVLNSNENWIIGNTISGTGTAIRVFNGSSRNLIEGNTVSGNETGIAILSDPAVDPSTENIIHDNSLTANLFGIHIRGNVEANIITDNKVTLSGKRGMLIYEAKDNQASGNTFELNCIGASIETDSSGNRLYNNNFINNGTQAVVIATAGPNNEFNLDLPAGGNYWNDFDQPAEGCPDVAPTDGFCDFAYIFSGGLDSHPHVEKDGWSGTGGGQVEHYLPVDPCASTDFDFDGILDALDNCPFDPNPDQADSDADRQGDICDLDDDNDGVEDVTDNCPVHFNPDQEDADGDGVGDACTFDTDGDGVANERDTCPATPLGKAVNQDGCSGAQLIEISCDADAFENHGLYVSCVAHAAQEAVLQGLITPMEKAGFVTEAAHTKP